jgi:hypothetical protein
VITEIWLAGCWITSLVLVMQSVRIGLPGQPLKLSDVIVAVAVTGLWPIVWLVCIGLEARAQLLRMSGVND